ncbi:glycosyltransferase family 32 protein [Roridomyces roridus]|uniref:Glycosyltransferase family 32 protein n=1 Tax=Roridomyces roridus TaxID=1738132 RepID=A0AAD7CFQ0_9AGAR|nr:glycosyltransferase family 32 protein [Roridomyces roridus]
MLPSTAHLRQHHGRPQAKYHPLAVEDDKTVSAFGFRFRLAIPNLRSVHLSAVSRFGHRRGALVLLCALLAIAFVVFAFTTRFLGASKKWPGEDSPTLVFRRESLGRIWQWEIASGHYPNRGSVPKKLGLEFVPDNPAVPPQTAPPNRFTTIPHGIGAKRTYLGRQSVAYPPRPVPGSIADFDTIQDHCDFAQGKVLLRIGGGLDNGNRVRRGQMDDWKYIYVEEPGTPSPSIPLPASAQHKGVIRSEHEEYLDQGFTKNRHAAYEPSIVLPPTAPQYRYTPEFPCDPDDPRVFHMYWAGEFTDKPYLAVLSFLYTQNTGLHLADGDASSICVPQLWIWINPGPAGAISSAKHDLLEQLKASPWAAPFLHPKFKDLIHFKLWDTVEQLDSLEETRNDWRLKTTLFKSDLLTRAGSQSADSYDKLSVILSDMARFILCYKYGGIYVDTDTLFLRDWEELWGWKGAFAYRWSIHNKYNTAVLRIRRGSPLGHFILRTAVKNGFDFHPFEITKYLREASLEGLLHRLPDAMFDAAWLNMEKYQRDRPPQPFFLGFEEFFQTRFVDSAAPEALGFRGFFSGSFSYHFHNSWWLPVDPTMNWPQLGPKFQNHTNLDDAEDTLDLPWSAVLKRTFEAYIRGESPNQYGEFLVW